MFLNRLTIKARLILAFSLMLIIFVLFGFISIIQMNKLGKLTKTMYEHPLRVSNAALRASMGVIKMHNYMKNISLADSNIEIEDIIQNLRFEEINVYNDLDIVKKQILGEDGKALEQNTRELFTKWKTIRNNTIKPLINKKKQNADKFINKQEEEQYVEMLEQKMMELTSYARKKADGFMNDAQKTQQHIIGSTIAIIFTVAFLSFLIAFFMAKSILSCLIDLKDTMAEITSTGKFVKSHMKGKHEIAKMAVHFNVLIEMLQNQFWNRDGLNQLNQNLSGELTYNELLTKSINFISRYTNSCIGALYIYDSKKKLCKLKSSFAFVERKYLSNKFNLGQGIVGQVAVEKKPILLKNINQDQALAVTGTTSEPPKNIYALPLVYEEQLYGVLEVGSFEDINLVKKEFLNSAAQIITISLYTAYQRDQIQKLLESERISNEALKLKTEELSETNDKLTAMNEELKAQSDELQAQAEELKAQKYELEAQRIQVEEADKLKSEFLSNMSHELRTPLNSVLALSQLMISRGTGKDLKQEIQYLHVIERNGRHLLNLINDILDLSKIEAGRMDLYLTDFSPKQAIQNVLDTILPLADEKGLDIKTNIDESLMICSDEDKMHQILLNIISNAVKFTQQGEININVYESNQMIFFSVKDTGIGIPESEQDHIFDEFRQVDGSTTRVYEGTGLGLAICQKLANLMGGSISVRSRPDKGSIFTFSVPLDCKDKDHEVESITMLKSDANSSSNFIQETEFIKESPSDNTILVVDDDEEVRNILSDYLIEAGYNVVTASRGRQGLKLARNIQPFAITLDILMPDMDGWEVIRELKFSDDTKNIPVIIISISNDRATGMALGAAGYVVKPIDRTILLSEIKKLSSFKKVKRILTVDDDPIVLHQLEDLLGGQGYIVETASNGREAIAKAVSSPPDVMILDLIMPEIDGFTVLDKIRKEPSICDLPVIILTAKDLNLQERMQLKDAVHRIVTKSIIDNDELLRKLETALKDIKKSSKPIKQKNPLILVVEDNEVAALQIQSALEEKGYRVHTAFGGTQAIEFVNHTIPDAIVLDLMMPEVDGFQVLENIRSTSKTSKLPVLVLTAKELTAQERSRLSHNNIQQLIQKGSVDRRRLVKCISKLLTKKIQKNKDSISKNIAEISVSDNESASKTLLLVEDNPDNLIAITAILDEFGYKYITAGDGKKAVEKAKLLHPDLILMDVQLPVLSGLDATKQIKSDPDTASIPVIAVTAKAMRGDKEKILAAGCDDYLSKPIYPSSLINILKKWSH